jgi:mono/diheme cytochrome c family protein
MKTTTLLLFLGLVSSLALAESDSDPAGQLYQHHCASCHGIERTGGMGPALLPPNLARLRRQGAADVITHGRVATQMPAFADKLSKAQIDALVAYIYQAPDKMPEWTASDIRSSRKQLDTGKAPVSKPIFSADPQNLFVVVETGDHHATILDGDTFSPLTRFKTHYALHGGPKFTRDGRYVYFASRDGWISKYDLYALRYVAEVRAGINTRNIAVSDDGRYVAVANYWPHNLVILDGRDLTLETIIPVRGKDGQSSRVSAVYHARPRKSFVAALKDIPELWEIPYDEQAVAPFTGLVHDYRPESGEPLPKNKGQFVPRRIELDAILDDFFFSPDYRMVMGAARPKASGTHGNIKGGQVIHLDVRRKIADLDLPGMPHLGSGISWMWKGRRILATPNLRDARITFIDMDNWRTIKTLPTLGPGFFMRSHENTPYAWADVFSGPNRDAIHIIDKRTLEIVKTLRPEPGKTVAHVEFTKDGRYALVSVIEQDGALLVMDAKTFKVIRRLPMKRPVGKYNVYNKTHLSEGTSH